MAVFRLVGEKCPELREVLVGPGGAMCEQVSDRKSGGEGWGRGDRDTSMTLWKPCGRCDLSSCEACINFLPSEAVRYSCILSKTNQNHPSLLCYLLRYELLPSTGQRPSGPGEVGSSDFLVWPEVVQCEPGGGGDRR